MIKKFLKNSITAFCLITAISCAVSCGRTVQLTGYNYGNTPPAPTMQAHPEVKETAPGEFPTEPPTEARPERVTVDTKMPEGYELKRSCALSGFETVMQKPELPTGCEVTALTQTLRYYGFDADKLFLCDKLMPTDFDGWYTMNEVYLGDPHSNNGFGCNPPVIVKTAGEYFDYLGSDWYAVDLTGISLAEVFYQVEQGRPVIVWSTIDQRETHDEFQFRLGCGEDFYFNPYQHCLTVYGFDYDKGTVHVADPLVGNVEYDMARFERIYDNMHDRAVILVGNEQSKGEDYTTDEEKEEWLRENHPELFEEEPTESADDEKKEENKENDE